MQRIIYYNEEYGYCVVDVKLKHDLRKKLAFLTQYEAEIICVFDVEQNQFSFKCKGFELHLQLMKASHERTFLGKLFNKLSFIPKPSYGLISKMEVCSKEVAQFNF
jgi:hypothetical protein